jgi:pimeloyl-ACP methyl ester carboxylesterase
MPLIDLEPTFGKKQQNVLQWNPMFFIRHGIGSSHKPFVSLAQFLQSTFPKSTVDNQSYDWKDSVLLNGARLAKQVVNTNTDRPLILIGHSMGGLLCRVANVALTDPSGFVALAKSLAPQLTYPNVDVLSISALQLLPPKSPITAMITLATPNSGAMLAGQLSGIPYLLKTALNLFPPTNLQSVADLTSSRLFRFLQNFSVNTRTLSISGSQGNRFARASGQLTAWVGKAGLKMEMPNDLIVEDRSVDLQYSILPNEILHHGKSPYKHARCYLDCVDVAHTNIYDNQNVRNLMVDFLERC